MQSRIEQPGPPAAGLARSDERTQDHRSPLSNVSHRTCSQTIVYTCKVYGCQANLWQHLELVPFYPLPPEDKFKGQPPGAVRPRDTKHITWSTPPS